MQAVSPDFQTVSFGEQVELLAAEVTPRRDAARVSAVWRFSSPGEAYVNVHFAGTEHESRKQWVKCRPEDVGQPIVMNMVVYQGEIRSSRWA